MKKMWKLNNKAVSPVIATILMVAITVVLAAVLYVMVMGFGGGGANETPAGSLTYAKTADLNYTVTLASIGKTGVLASDITVTYSPTVSGAPTALTPIIVETTQTLHAGDYAQVHFTTAGTYLVSINYAPTGNNIATVTINAS